MSPIQGTTIGGSSSILPLSIDSRNSFPVSWKPYFPVPPPTRSSGMSDSEHHLPTSSNVPLSWTLAGDVSIAALVTGVVAPFLTVVDKALVQRSAGSHTILESALSSCRQIITHPIQHVKSPTFLWMWATYASTYTAANALDSITKERTFGQHDRVINELEKQKPSSSYSTAAVFLGTTAVNTTASLLKDRAYAHLFGSSSPSVGVPLPAYGLWMARDFTVIGSSFILPEYVAKLLSSGQHDKHQSMIPIAQLLTPVLAQVIAGPLHFLGLDVFNYRNQSVQSRFLRLRESASSVIAARMVRILPGYGIAGVWNRKLRSSWKESWWTFRTTRMFQDRSLLATSSSVNK